MPNRPNPPPRCASPSSVPGTSTPGTTRRRTQEHPDAELIAVWDDDPERGRGLRRRVRRRAGRRPAGAARPVATSTRVTVTTSTVAHREVIWRAVAAGKHIFTEKLLAPTVAEAEEIIAAADAQPASGWWSRCPRLYHGYTTAITEMLAAGTLGRLTYARVRLSHDGAVAGWLPERFFDPATGGRRRADRSRLPPGLPGPAVPGHHPGRPSAPPTARVTGRAVEDHAVVTVGYDDRAIGVIEAGFVSSNPFTIEVFGTEGSAALLRRHRELRSATPRARLALAVPAAGRCCPTRTTVGGRTSAPASRRPTTSTARSSSPDWWSRPTRPPAAARRRPPATREPATTERSSSTMIKVGLIGGGGVANAHIRGYAAHADDHRDRGRRRRAGDAVQRRPPSSAPRASPTTAR